MLSRQTCPPILLTFLESFENNLVPSPWLHTFTTQTHLSVPLDHWLSQLRDRRALLGTWLTVKHCDLMKLHLLQNPQNLFIILREIVSEKVKIPLEKVFIEMRIVDLPHGQADRAALFSKIISQNCSTSVAMYTILVSNVILMNATWAKDKYSLEFMHPATSSRRSQVCDVTEPPLSVS
jgi:hypothetical protein